MSTAKTTSSGIEVRHRKACSKPRTDGKCCGASFQAQAYDKRAGKPIKRSFATRAAAKLWRRDAMHALEHGEGATANASKRTVAQALDGLIVGMEDGTALDRSGRRYRPATIRSYRQASEAYLKPALGHLRLRDVQRGDTQRVVDKLHAAGMSGSTIRNKLDPLRVVYRRAMQDDEITRNPTEKLRLPAIDTKARGIGNVERVGDLLEALPSEELAAWAMAFYAGLRVGELRALRWTQVDFAAGVIRVAAGWDDQEGEQETKTDAGSRSVPLVGRLRAILAAHKLATGREGDDLVFGRTRTDAFVRSTLRSRAMRAWGWKPVPNPLLRQNPKARPKVVWLRAREDALEPLTPHEARHTAVSYMAAAGLSPKEAQTAAGHADIRTTLNIYAKAVPGWESGAAAKMDAYLGDVAPRLSS